MATSCTRHIGLLTIATVLVTLGRVTQITAATDCSKSAIDFAAPVSFVPGHSVIAARPGDMNGDGLPDIVVAGAVSELSVMLNLGDGAFGAPVTYVAGTSQIDFTLADLTGNGALDVALVNLFDDTVTVLHNSGDGNLLAPVHYTTSPMLTFPRVVAAADFDIDGDIDLLVIGALFSEDKVVLENNGEGAFVVGGPSFAGGGGAIRIALADFDADGFLDAATSFAGAWIHRGKGDGTFAAPLNLIPAGGPTVPAIVAADLDLDGFVDVAAGQVGNGLEGTIHVFGNAGDGLSFSHAEFVVTSTLRDMAVGDFDGDGLPDLAVSHVSPTNLVSVLRNLGDLDFATPLEFVPGIYPLAISAVDVDGDGRPDLMTANQFSGPADVAVLFNQTFPPNNPSDLNCDGSVGVADLLILLANWGPCANPLDCPADLDGNGNVGVADLLILLANWG